jgi:Transposase DDE domain group 1
MVPPKGIVLDMDSSVSPTHGEQEMSVWNGHYACTCYHPLFVFNQFGDLERCALRPGNVHSADGWGDVLKPVVARYQSKVLRVYFRADAASPCRGSTSISKPSGSSMRSVFQPSACASVRRRCSCVQEQPTGGVRSNITENGRISRSTTVGSAQGDGSRPQVDW